MAYPRTSRIGEEVKKLVSHLIRNELKDPRISSLTSVVEVDVTKDLRYANIFVSVYGTQEEKDNTIVGLTKAAGFIRKEIGKNIKLRSTPEPVFKLDTSIEKGQYMSTLISKVNEKVAKEDDDDIIE